MMVVLLLVVLVMGFVFFKLGVYSMLLGIFTLLAKIGFVILSGVLLIVGGRALGRHWAARRTAVEMHRSL